MKSIFTIIVVFFSMLLTTAFAQNRLQLADTVKDETGISCDEAGQGFAVSRCDLCAYRQKRSLDYVRLIFCIIY